MTWCPVLVTETWHFPYIFTSVITTVKNEYLMRRGGGKAGKYTGHIVELLDKLSEGCCVTPCVMICISSQCANRPGGETKDRIHGSDGRLRFYCLLASFTGMVDTSNAPYLTIKNLTLSGKFLFHFVDFFLVFVQCLTKQGLIIWIPDHMNNKTRE